MPALLKAQSSSPLSIDVTLGGGSASGSAYHRRGGPSGDAFLALRTRDWSAGSLVIGANIGVQGPFGGADDCVIAPHGDCLPDVPVFSWLGGAMGWEGGRPGGSTFRIMAGPAFFRADEGSALAIQGRLVLSSPPLARISLVASARGAVLPNFRSDVLSVWSVGLGFRIH